MFDRADTGVSLVTDTVARLEWGIAAGSIGVRHQYEKCSTICLFFNASSVLQVVAKLK